MGHCMTANIRAQSATIQIYDTFTTHISLLLRVTITNNLNLEDQLFNLYEEIHTLVQSYLPNEEDDDDMPPLEDIADNDS